MEKKYKHKKLGWTATINDTAYATDVVTDSKYKQAIIPKELILGDSDWEEVKEVDYEILKGMNDKGEPHDWVTEETLKSTNGSNYYTCAEAGCPIHTVKCISTRATWSVGGSTQFGKILGFKLSQDGINCFAEFEHFDSHKLSELRYQREFEEFNEPKHFCQECKEKKRFKIKQHLNRYIFGIDPYKEGGNLCAIPFVSILQEFINYEPKKEQPKEQVFPKGIVRFKQKAGNVTWGKGLTDGEYKTWVSKNLEIKSEIIDVENSKGEVFSVKQVVMWENLLTQIVSFEINPLFGLMAKLTYNNLTVGINDISKTKDKEEEKVEIPVFKIYYHNPSDTKEVHDLKEDIVDVQGYCNGLGKENAELKKDLADAWKVAEDESRLNIKLKAQLRSAETVNKLQGDKIIELCKESEDVETLKSISIEQEEKIEQLQEEIKELQNNFTKVLKECQNLKEYIALKIMFKNL